MQTLLAIGCHWKFRALALFLSLLLSLVAAVLFFGNSYVAANDDGLSGYGCITTNGVDGVVNLRFAPSLAYSVVAIAEDGSCFDILDFYSDDDGTWVKVDAYVHADNMIVKVFPYIEPRIPPLEVRRYSLQDGFGNFPYVEFYNDSG